MSHARGMRKMNNMCTELNYSKLLEVLFSLLCPYSHDGVTLFAARRKFVYLLNHPFFLGSGTGSGALALLKNLSDESSSRTYQKYCAIGMMKEPTTRTAIKAVYFPAVFGTRRMGRKGKGSSESGATASRKIRHESRHVPFFVLVSFALL